MLILLTGATGFLGGHVLHALQDASYDVRVLVRGDKHADWLRERRVEIVRGDLGDYATLRRASHGAGGVIHCAALVAHWSRIDREQRHVNVEGTSNVLRAAGRARVGRIVHVSSIVTVGCTRDGRVVDEDERWSGQDQPRVHYVQTKREAEERAFAAARGGLPVTVVNPAVMIGSRAQDGRPNGHVGAVLAGESGRIHPGGGSVAHVADTARGIVRALEHAPLGERTILAGHNTPWLELRTRIARALGRPAPKGTWPLAVAPALVATTAVLDTVRLSRPRFAPDRFRIWGWYAYASSAKATRSLGYEVPRLDEVISRATSGERP